MTEFEEKMISLLESIDKKLEIIQDHTDDIYYTKSAVGDVETKLNEIISKISS